MTEPVNSPWKRFTPLDRIATRGVDNSPELFPVSRIADLLGVDRKTARGYFADAPEGRPLIVNGQAAQGWPV